MATKQRPARNGVDVPTLFATLDSFHGAGEERAHRTTFVHDADHPEVLVGGDRGTVPVVPDEVLREIVDQSRQRSAVYDVLTNGVPVAIDVTTA